MVSRGTRLAPPRCRLGYDCHASLKSQNQQTAFSQRRHRKTIIIQSPSRWAESAEFFWSYTWQKGSVTDRRVWGCSSVAPWEILRFEPHELLRWWRSVSRFCDFNVKSPEPSEETRATNAFQMKYQRPERNDGGTESRTKSDTRRKHWGKREILFSVRVSQERKHFGCEEELDTFELIHVGTFSSRGRLTRKTWEITWNILVFHGKRTRNFDDSPSSCVCLCFGHLGAVEQAVNTTCDFLERATF